MNPHRSDARRRAALSAACVLVTAAALASTGPAAVADDTGELYVVQGVPDAVLDISVDGEVVAEDVATADVVGPFAADGEVEVTASDGDDGDPVVAGAVDVAAGSSSDAVLHLPATGGEPLMTVFDNDLAAVPADKATLSVTHTAVVPPADIVVDGDVLFANVANGETLDVVVPAGDYSVEIVPTGETGPVVLGPADLTVAPGTLTKVYAVGDPAQDTMTVAVHELGVATTGSLAPDVVDTGVPNPVLAFLLVLTSWARLG